MSTPPAPTLPELGALRSFVTVVDLTELAEHGDRAAAYFRAFGHDDDATLLVYAATDDAAWAESVVLGVLSAAGTDPDGCADVLLCLVDGGARSLDRIARRAHAVLTVGDGSWLPTRRTAYGWGDLDALRRQAERLWGKRDGGAAYSYDAAIAHVVARGWTTEHHAREGSVPEKSLRAIATALDEHAPASAPRLLHVGNFVGVSLSYLLDWARGRDGITVSIDPDIPHRGVERPQRVVNDLLAHFGLTERHVLVCGYSLEKSFSNDSVVFGDYDPASAWASETAPENVLRTLADSGQAFDAAFIDGNHDPSYLRRELAEITRMLAPGGLLVLDDVDEWWEGIREVFDEVAEGEWPYEPVEADGRVGILRKL